ncbi:hypothetical protein Drose_19960 [Dactylosporangium roseum]|uniref:Uncharacterized protein n=1 Tax=Dactylosporangium roseum TaxID=47989 RepID=A0ABY5ZF84_9ACTN|nr:hypothetical protein [Dactylosporangium roseum]UWZ40838.1 hypothetical protein Drose_19960 [Dactylosporangium roseum]
MTVAVDDAAAAVMGWLPARPRLLALGEPTHGEDVLLDVRNSSSRRATGRSAPTTGVVRVDLAVVVPDKPEHPGSVPAPQLQDRRQREEGGRRG